MLLDLTNLDVSGKELQKRCDEVYITLNKKYDFRNDPRSPFVTSGVSNRNSCGYIKRYERRGYGKNCRADLVDGD